MKRYIVAAIIMAVWAGVAHASQTFEQRIVAVYPSAHPRVFYCGSYNIEWVERDSQNALFSLRSCRDLGRVERAVWTCILQEQLAYCQEKKASYDLSRWKMACEYVRTQSPTEIPDVANDILQLERYQAELLRDEIKKKCVNVLSSTITPEQAQAWVSVTSYTPEGSSSVHNPYARQETLMAAAYRMWWQVWCGDDIQPQHWHELMKVVHKATESANHKRQSFENKTLATANQTSYCLSNLEQLRESVVLSCDLYRFLDEAYKHLTGHLPLMQKRAQEVLAQTSKPSTPLNRQNDEVVKINTSPLPSPQGGQTQSNPLPQGNGHVTDIPLHDTAPTSISRRCKKPQGDTATSSSKKQQAQQREEKRRRDAEALKAKQAKQGESDRQAAAKLRVAKEEAAEQAAAKQREAQEREATAFTAAKEEAQNLATKLETTKRAVDQLIVNLTKAKDHPETNLEQMVDFETQLEQFKKGSKEFANQIKALKAPKQSGELIKLIQKVTGELPEIERTLTDQAQLISTRMALLREKSENRQAIIVTMKPHISSLLILITKLEKFMSKLSDSETTNESLRGRILTKTISKGLGVEAFESSIQGIQKEITTLQKALRQGDVLQARLTASRLLSLLAAIETEHQSFHSKTMAFCDGELTQYAEQLTKAKIEFSEEQDLLNTLDALAAKNPKLGKGIVTIMLPNGQTSQCHIMEHIQKEQERIKGFKDVLLEMDRAWQAWLPNAQIKLRNMRFALVDPSLQTPLKGIWEIYQATAAILDQLLPEFRPDAAFLKQTMDDMGERLMRHDLPRTKKLIQNLKERQWQLSSRVYAQGDKEYETFLASLSITPKWQKCANTAISVLVPMLEANPLVQAAEAEVVVLAKAGKKKGKK